MNSMEDIKVGTTWRKKNGGTLYKVKDFTTTGPSLYSPNISIDSVQLEPVEKRQGARTHWKAACLLPYDYDLVPAGSEVPAKLKKKKESKAPPEPLDLYEKPGDMEWVFPDSIRVYGNTCMGCERFGADVMVAILRNPGEKILDVFLSTRQTKELVKELQEALKRNGKKKGRV